MLAKDLKQQFCMPVAAPAYPQPPIYFEGGRLMYVYFQTAPDVVQALVPEPLVPDPQSVLALYIATFTVTKPVTLRYHEAAVVVPVRYGKQTGVFFSHLYLDTATGIVGGREIWGFPKKEAEITFEEAGTELSGLVIHGGSPLIRVTVQLDRTPAPVPQDRPQAAFNLKLIPSIRRGAPPDVLQLTSTPIKEQIRERYVGSGTLELLPSPYDPLGNIPVLGVVGAELLVSDLVLDWGEVLVDYLAEREKEGPMLATAT